MIKVTIEIEQLPCAKAGRVHGAIALRSHNVNATAEEMRILEQVCIKIQEIGKDIGQEQHSEVAIYEKKYKQKNVRHSQPANH